MTRHRGLVWTRWQRPWWRNSLLWAWVPGRSDGWGDAPPITVTRLWELLRDADDRYHSGSDPQILSRAADLVEADPEGEAWEGPLTFSTQRFEQYLARHDIPWPRLASGRLGPG